MSTDDPAVQRRRLRVELRALRKDANRTQREVADAMDWSPSKIIRIENGEVRITPIDLRALLTYYGVKDARRVESLVQQARSSRQDSWAEFKDVHTPPWLTYLAYESSASRISNYECLLVPGLLQTEEYALAVYAAGGLAEDVAEKRWEGRLRRQALHDSADAPAMAFILDEAVLHRHVGGQRVMRRQLQKLVDFGGLPHVTLRVIPFSSGIYRRLGQSFVVLEFPDPNDDDLLHIEDPGGGVTMRDEVDLTSDAAEHFLQMEDQSLSPDETLALINSLIERGASNGPPAKDKST